MGPRWTRRSEVLTVTTLVVLVGVAGCGRAMRKLPSVPEGTLSGVLAVCCTIALPGSNGSTPVAGIIALNRIGGGSRVIAVDHTGHFSIALPIGTYEGVGGIPTLDWKLGQCKPIRPTSASPAASPIVIRRNFTTHVWIVCVGQ